MFTQKHAEIRNELTSVDSSASTWESRGVLIIINTFTTSVLSSLKLSEVSHIYELKLPGDFQFIAHREFSSYELVQTLCYK